MSVTQKNQRGYIYRTPDQGSDASIKVLLSSSIEVRGTKKKVKYY